MDSWVRAYALNPAPATGGEVHIERVVIHVRGGSEHVDVEIHWFGGHISRHPMIRPMRRYDRLESYPLPVTMVTKGRAAGLTAKQIAERLNAEGFRPPSGRSSEFSKNTVNMLLNRLGKRRPIAHHHELQADEWWLPDLAAELQIRVSHLRHWLAKYRPQQIRIGNPTRLMPMALHPRSGTWP